MDPKPELFFDFSSSARGGALRRINAFADFFSNHPLPTHFFINNGVPNKVEIAQKVRVSFVEKSGWSKLTIDSRHLLALEARPKWCYSYGIPIKTRFAWKHWLHLSNVLPFTFRQCSLPWQLRWKSFAQLQQYKRCSSNVDMLSGESNFTLASACTALDWSGQTALLRNGVTSYPIANLPTERYALAVGTEDYKRIDLTFEVYNTMKQELGLTSLVIVGVSAGIPEHVKNALDVICESHLSQDALMSRYRRASYYISTSEVENSSLAVLEGLALTGKVILSDIPSHREMLQHTPGTFSLNGKPYLRVDDSAPNAAILPEWNVEIGKMLNLMGLD
jgi:glycosyltransferase involved in cell wall biosynthesis